MSSTARYRQPRIGGCLEATVERRNDGTAILRSTEPLREYPRRLMDRFEHWARVAPDRVLVARRSPGGGDWIRITYAQMLERARSVGQALLERRVTVERPVAILSDNDLEHLTLAFGAIWAGVPYTPISPAYSVVSQDHAKLRHIFATTTPKLVFASGPEYGKAINAVAAADLDVVLAHGTIEGRKVTPFRELLETRAGAQVDAAHAAV
ncbi:MAG TPA: AMP-binding protein, partial [Burkholderiaceae bacterium]|nr:AMP-binding protein [Burkholderiaceae bacterium]